MDRGAWRATVHGVEDSRTRLSTHTTAGFPSHKKLKAHKILQWDSFLLTTATDPGKSRKHTHTHTHTEITPKYPFHFSVLHSAQA